jgi:ketosteroid isomerase-like protein
VLTGPLDVIRAVYVARRRNDLAGMMALCHPSISFTFNVDPDKIGSGTTYIGVAASLEHLARVAAVWEQIHHDVTSLNEEGDTVRANVTFSMRYRETAQILEGTKRQIWTVRHGVVTRLDETLDRDYIQAFMLMTSTAAR